jgi:hypothetical protein
MTTGSASYHKVRVTPSDDPSGAKGTFIDYVVWDAISVIKTNGQEVIFNVNGAAADPGNNQKTHLLAVTNPSDPTQTCQFEILDSVALISTNGQELLIHTGIGGAQIYTVNYNSDPVTGNPLVQTENPIVSSKAAASRLEIVNVITEGGPTDPSTLTPTSDYILSGYPSGISTGRANGQEFLINRFSGGPFDDTTQYVTDANGNLVPPVNPDPNVYAVIPTPSADIGLSMGSALVSQGLLWQICNIGSNRNSVYMKLEVGFATNTVGSASDYHVYGWNAIPDLIPGYINTVTPAADGLQVPAGSNFNSDFSKIYAVTNKAVYNPMTIFPFAEGDVGTAVFNLKKLVGFDGTNLGADFVLLMHGTVGYYAFILTLWRGSSDPSDPNNKPIPIYLFGVNGGGVASGGSGGVGALNDNRPGPLYYQLIIPATLANVSTPVDGDPSLCIQWNDSDTPF